MERTNLSSIASGPCFCFICQVKLFFVIIMLMPFSLNGGNDNHPGGLSGEAVTNDRVHSKSGFGIGLASCVLFTSEPDQILYPGFNVFSNWNSNEWMLEFRGRFFFGEMDIYQFEGAGYRPLKFDNPLFYIGGGFGYGGMNRKKVQISTINNQPFQGILFYNGNGVHSFLGVSYRYPYKPMFSFRFDIDYMLTFYNVDEIRMPSGIRLALTMILNVPD